MSNNVDYFSKRLGFTRKEIAKAIGKSTRTVSAKVNNVIPWTQLEIAQVTELLRTKDQRLNVEVIFFSELYSITRGHLERQAEFHASTQDEA